MTDINAVPTEGVAGVTITDDGSYALFKLKTTIPEPDIAIPTEALLDLIAVTSHVFSEAQKIRQANSATRHVFPTDWWEVLPHPDGQHVIMSFRINGGAQLSFQVHRDGAAHFQEALTSMLVPESLLIPNSETPRH